MLSSRDVLQTYKNRFPAPRAQKHVYSLPFFKRTFNIKKHNNLCFNRLIYKTVVKNATKRGDAFPHPHIFFKHSIIQRAQSPAAKCRPRASPQHYCPYSLPAPEVEPEMAGKESPARVPFPLARWNPLVVLSPVRKLRGPSALFPPVSPPLPLLTRFHLPQQDVPYHISLAFRLFDTSRSLSWDSSPSPVCRSAGRTSPKQHFRHR